MELMIPTLCLPRWLGEADEQHLNASAALDLDTAVGVVGYAREEVSELDDKLAIRGAGEKVDEAADAVEQADLPATPLVVGEAQQHIDREFLYVGWVLLGHDFKQRSRTWQAAHIRVLLYAPPKLAQCYEGGLQHHRFAC